MSFCNYKTVEFDPEIQEGHYELILELKPNAVMGIPSDVEVVSYEADVQLENPNFTKFVLFWRYFLLLLNVLMYCYFSKKMKMVGPRQVLIEQRLVKALGITLMLWNDPLAFINVLYPNITT